MSCFKHGIITVACLGLSLAAEAKQPAKLVISPHASIISSPTALYDLMTAEFLAHEKAFSAASKIYFPYALNSSKSDIVSRATVLAFLSGDLQQTMRLATHWLKLSPKDQTAYQLLLTSQLSFEHYGAANTTLNRYLKIQKDNKSTDTVTPVLKALVQRLGESSAVDRWERLIARSTDVQIRYRLQLALGAFLLEGHDAKVIARGMETLKKAMSTRPQAVEPKVHYAILMAKDDPEKAGLWLRDELVQRIIPSEESFFITGIILSARQQLAFARPLLEQAVQRYPKNIAFHVLYLQSLLENRAEPEAQKELVYLLESFDPKEERTTHMAIQLMRLAKTPEQREKAISFLKRVPESDEYFEPVQEIILMQLSELNISQATTYIEQQHASPTAKTFVKPSWWLFPIESLHKQKKIKEALELVDHAIGLNPEADELLEAKALLLSESGKMKEAEAIWRKLIERMPEQHSFYNNLGYILLEKLGRTAEAEPLIRKAYALAPQDSAVLDSLGWLYFKMNQPQEALKYIENALSKGNPGDAEILLHLLEVYSALGDAAKAQKTLLRIEELKSKEWLPLKEIQKRLGIKGSI